MVRQAEELLGVRLPQSYVQLMYRQNGGLLKRTCFPTGFRTSWSADHFQVDIIRGIGYEKGIDEQSNALIFEWKYPDVGVVIGVTPAAGPDTVMLDYSESGPDGEPAVVYVDEDRVRRWIADSFESFINGLVSEEEYSDEDDE
jgi:hypothetical protein